MTKHPNLEKLRAAFHALTLDQAKQLYAELGAIVEALEQQSIFPAVMEATGREVVTTQRIGDRLYQLERVRCGKVGCKCAGEAGELHGPYWYAYWRDQGKLKSRYVGKRWRSID